MLARIPMIPTVIMSSTKEKPFCDFKLYSTRYAWNRWASDMRICPERSGHKNIVTARNTRAIDSFDNSVFAIRNDRIVQTVGCAEFIFIFI